MECIGSRSTVSLRGKFVLARLQAAAIAALLVGASFAGAVPAVAAVCGTTGKSCVLDAQCCARLVCGPARTCQSGCRIDRVFVRAGTRDPSNPCRVCDPGKSTTAYSPALDGSACGEGTTCRTGATCRAGMCVTGGPRACGDGDACTIDSCDASRGCVHEPVPCDDGDPCTKDRCDSASGRCTSVSDGSVCDDGNDCTADACDPVAGCSHPGRTGPCDDRDACTTGDACTSAVCAGGPPPDCADENPCTLDRCEPALGCVNDGGPLLRPGEAGAFLVFPKIVASSLAEGAAIETRVEIRNISTRSIIAHVAFLNGDGRDPRYCDECDFDVPLRSRQTVVLEIQRVGSLTKLRNAASGATRWCAARIGFLTVDVEDAAHAPLAANVLVGSETVTNATLGTSFTVPAIAIQSVSNDGNRAFEFDGDEYVKLPAALKGEFLTPDPNGPVTVDLVVFTLGFRRAHPPLTDCSVIGEELPHGLPFSASFQFGCFTSIPLPEIDPEFAYPDLGGERGRIRLRCAVFGETGEAAGGVYGILLESDGAGTIRARLLDTGQSAGCPVKLQLADPARGFSTR